MTPRADGKRVVRRHRRPDVPERQRAVRERGQHVDLGQRRRRVLDRGGLRHHLRPQGLEELRLEHERARRGPGDLLLALLQFRRREALAVHDRLLALVVRRHVRELGGGHFDEVAEDVVELDLERLDPGASDLLGLIGGDPRAPVRRRVAQVVELRVDARADEPAVAEGGGRRVHERRLDRRHQLGKVVEAPGRRSQQPRAVPRQRRQPLADARHGLEPRGDGLQIAGVAAPQRDPRDRALEVAHAPEQLAQRRERRARLRQRLHRVVARADGVKILEGPRDPAPQQARAHRRPGRVEDAVEGRGGVPRGTGQQIEMLARPLVEDHAAGRLAEAQAPHVRQVAAQVLADMLDQRAGGGRDMRQPLAAEAVEGGHVEMADQRRIGGHGIEEHRVDRRDAADVRLLHQRRQRGVQNAVRGGCEALARGEAAERFDEGGWRFVRLDRELAGREVERGQAQAARSAVGEGHEVVVAVVAQHALLGHGARSDDARDLAPDDALGRGRVFHLIADGDLEVGADELREIGVEGVVGDPAHRVAAALRERDAQDRRGAPRVLEEHLVEVPETEHDDHVFGDFGLDALVLAHHRCEIFGHRDNSSFGVRFKGRF